MNKTFNLKKSKKLIIFGANDTAKLAHYYFQNDTEYEVVAFTVDPAYIQENEFQGLPLLSFETIESQYPPSQYDLFVAVSYNQINKLRAKKFQEALDKGYTLPSYISSKASVWSESIGRNCFIMEDNTIQPFVSIGDNVVLWSGNHIGHDTVIQDHCFISSHVVVSGHVVVEPYCFLGVNATIRNAIRIATECVIGAGAIIVKNTEPKGVYIGSAASKYKLNSDELPSI
jgi:sugar O-acyltransferase (sialic acid O-acetyltransferase NeuD family)